MLFAPMSLKSIAKVIAVGLSDHELVGYAPKLNNLQQSWGDKRCRNYKNYNPKSFYEDIKHENLDQLYSKTCTNSALDKFNRGTSRCIDKDSTVKKKTEKAVSWDDFSNGMLKDSASIPSLYYQSCQKPWKDFYNILK